MVREKSTPDEGHFWDFLKPTSGRIEYSEELKKAGIGYLPQQTDAQKDFPATVFEVVISGCLGGNAAAARFIR